jgi:hypothetical protein
MDQDRVKDWRELCQAAANELDPKNLMALIAEITRALDERDARLPVKTRRWQAEFFPSVLWLKYQIRRRPVVRIAKFRFQLVGRFIVQAGSAESFGHLTMAHPELWSEHVAEFMRSLGDEALQSSIEK